MKPPNIRFYKIHYVCKVHTNGHRWGNKQKFLKPLNANASKGNLSSQNLANFMLLTQCNFIKLLSKNDFKIPTCCGSYHQALLQNVVQQFRPSVVCGAGMSTVITRHASVQRCCISLSGFTPLSFLHVPQASFCTRRKRRRLLVRSIVRVPILTSLPPMTILTFVSRPGYS